MYLSLESTVATVLENTSSATFICAGAVQMQVHTQCTCTLFASVHVYMYTNVSTSMYMQ